MTRYFCYDTYEPAGRPQMENIIMNVAKTMYIDCILVDPFKAVDFLKAKQDLEYEQNRRLKKINIYFSEGALGHAWMHIGSSSLRFKAIRENDPTL